MRVVSWYFWKDVLSTEQSELVTEIIGVDGWTEALVPSPAILDMRNNILERWPDLADEIQPIDLTDFPPGMNPYPDEPDDIMQRYIRVTLFGDKVSRERGMITMAKSYDLACYDDNTGQWGR